MEGSLLYVTWVTEEEEEEEEQEEEGETIECTL